MKLFALFLVFGFVVCTCCEEAKKADVKTEEKKNVKAKLANLSKMQKRAKDYNAGRQKRWGGSSWYPDHSASPSCRGYGEYCHYSSQCCGAYYCVSNYCGHPATTATPAEPSEPCRRYGRYCHYDYQCCNYNCVDNFCQDYTTAADYTTGWYHSTRRYVSKEEFNENQEEQEKREDHDEDWYEINHKKAKKN